jgi:hypothetical protein
MMQQEQWVHNSTATFDPDSTYAVSTLLHTASDPTFLLVSVRGQPRAFDRASDTVLQVKRKRSLPRNAAARRAYQAGLVAVKEDPNFIEADICAVKQGCEVVEIVLRPWESRQKGILPVILSCNTGVDRFVVPAHLVRMRVDIVVADSPVKVPKKTMHQLYKACRVFYVCLAVFWSARPYYVMLGCREMCACPYHLRFEYQVLGLRNLLVELWAQNKLSISKERHDELILLLSDPSRFRYALMCEREEDAEYSLAQCVSGDCSNCGGLKRVLEIFHDVKKEVFGASDFGVDDLSQMAERRHDLREEEAVELEDREIGEVEVGAGGIEYNRHMRTLHQRKDGTKSKEKEFVKTVVLLCEFWADVKGFVTEFFPHHELAKSQGREFAALKSTDPVTKAAGLLPRHARGTIDYLQRYTIKRGRKETQQEFFAQLGMTLLVVSLRYY